MSDAASVPAGSSASAASLTRSVELKATPQEVWAVIGPFCAIKDWHPAIGECTQTGPADAPVRTLVTKDGKVTFVEAQTERTPASYSYVIQSSPLPLSDYHSTLGVAAGANGSTEVTWTSRFSPFPGQDKAAVEGVAGIYDPGLAALKARFGS